MFINHIAIFVHVEKPFLFFYSENQSKVVNDRITHIEEHLGQLCDIASSYTRKTARLRDKGH